MGIGNQLAHVMRRTRQRGASGMTYGLLVGLISVVALVSVEDIGENVDTLLGGTGETLEQAATGGAITLALSALNGTSLTEGDSGSTSLDFRIRREGSTVPLTVDWQVTGSGGASGADFAGGVLPSGSVSFADGQSSAEFSVDVAGDTLFEGDESFTVALGSTSRSAEVTGPPIDVLISDDDALPGFAISAADADRDEGQGSFTFTLTRNGASAQAASVDWAVTGGDPGLDGADFSGGVLPSGSVTYGAEDTSQTITLTIADDSTSEGDEGFTIEITGVTGGGQIGSPATASGVIRNDDIVAPTGSGTEGDPYRYSDGSYAESCLSYFNGGGSYAPMTSSGVYQLQPGGSGSVYTVACDMTTDGGGWTILAGDPLYDNGVYPFSPTLDGSGKTYTNGEYFARQGSSPSGNCHTPQPRFAITVPFAHSELYYSVRARSHNICGGSRVIHVDFGGDGVDYYTNMAPCGQYTVQTSTYTHTRTSPTGTVSSGYYYFRGASCQNFNSTTQSQVTVYIARVR